jgi:hypothetical protein
MFSVMQLTIVRRMTCDEEHALTERFSQAIKAPGFCEAGGFDLWGCQAVRAGLMPMLREPRRAFATTRRNRLGELQHTLRQALRA